MILIDKYIQHMKFESNPATTFSRFLNVEKQQYEVFVDLSKCKEFTTATLQNTLRLQVYNVVGSEKEKRCLQFDIGITNLTSQHDTKMFFNIGDKFETVLFVKVKFNFKKLIINSKTQKIDEKKEIDFFNVLRIYE